MTPYFDPNEPDSRPTKQKGETQAAFQQRESDWYARRASPTTVGKAMIGMPSPSMKYGGSMSGGSGGAMLGGFRLEASRSLPSPTYSSPIEFDDGGDAELDSIRIQAGESDLSGQQIPAKSPRPLEATVRPRISAAFLAGPAGAVPSGLREPEDAISIVGVNEDRRPSPLSLIPPTIDVPLSEYFADPPTAEDEIASVQDSRDQALGTPPGIPAPVGLIGRMLSSSAATTGVTYGGPGDRSFVGVAPAQMDESYTRTKPCSLASKSADRADPKAAVIVLGIGDEVSGDLSIAKSFSFKKVSMSPCEAIGLAVSCLPRYAAVYECGCSKTCPSEVEINPTATVEWEVTSADVPTPGAGGGVKPGPWPTDIEKDLWLGCINSVAHTTGDSCDAAKPTNTANGHVVLYTPPPMNLAPAAAKETVRRLDLVATIKGPSIAGGARFSATLTIAITVTRVAERDGDRFEREVLATLAGATLDSGWKPSTPECGCQLDPPTHVDVVTISPTLRAPASLDAPALHIISGSAGASRQTKITCSRKTGVVCGRSVSRVLPAYDVAIEYTWIVSGPFNIPKLIKGVGLDAIAIGFPVSAASAGVLTVGFEARVARESAVFGGGSAAVSVNAVRPRVIAAMAYGAGGRPRAYKPLVQAAATVMAGGDSRRTALKEFDGAVVESDAFGNFTDSNGKTYDSGRGTVAKAAGFPNVFVNNRAGAQMAKWVASELLRNGPNQVVFIAGHSLGGNAATQAANELAARGIGADELLLLDRQYHPHNDFGVLLDADKKWITGKGPAPEAARDLFALTGEAANSKTGVVHIADMLADRGLANFGLTNIIYRHTGGQRPTTGGRSAFPGQKPSPVRAAHDMISSDPAAFATVLARWSGATVNSGRAPPQPVNSCRAVLVYKRGVDALATWIASP